MASTKKKQRRKLQPADYNGFQWVFFIAFPYIFEKLSYLLMLALFVWFGLSSADWIAVRDALAKPVRDYLQEEMNLDFVVWIMSKSPVLPGGGVLRVNTIICSYFTPPRLIGDLTYVGLLLWLLHRVYASMSVKLTKYTLVTRLPAWSAYTIAFALFTRCVAYFFVSGAGNLPTSVLRTTKDAALSMYTPFNRNGTAELELWIHEPEVNIMLSNNVTELADAIARLQALLNERIVALSHCDLLFARIDRHELGSLILHVSVVGPWWANWTTIDRIAAGHLDPFGGRYSNVTAREVSSSLPRVGVVQHVALVLTALLLIDFVMGVVCHVALLTCQTWEDSELTCPITNHIMVLPVLAADGCTYEKWAIEKWVKERKDANKPVTSPVTGVEFGHNELTLNRAVQGHILLRYPKLSTAAYEQAADFAQTGAESGRGARITTSPPSVGPMARSAVQAIAASKIDKGKSVDEIVPAAASAKVRGQATEGRALAATFADAARADSPNQLDLLIKAGAIDVNKPWVDYDYDEDGVSDVFNSTYLCIAAYANRPLNVVVLIAAGADIDALSDADPNHSHTAIHAAAGEGHVECVEILLLANANSQLGYYLDAEDPEQAIKVRPLDTVREKLRLTRDYLYNGELASRYLKIRELRDPTSEAVQTGSIQELESLPGRFPSLSHPPIMKHFVNSVDTLSGLSAVAIAASTGSLECVAWLISGGADVTLASAISGRTALHMAALCEELSTAAVVALLRYHGASVDVPDNAGITPYQLSAGKPELRRAMRTFLLHSFLDSVSYERVVTAIVQGIRQFVSSRQQAPDRGRGGNNSDDDDDMRSQSPTPARRRWVTPRDNIDRMTEPGT